MILLIIYTLFKKFNIQSWIGRNFKISKFFKVKIQSFLASLFMTLMLLIPMLSKAQNLQLNYKIIRNGDDIGWMRLEKNNVGNNTDLLLVTEIKTKIIFPITVFAKDSSIFEKGNLIYSSQIRKTNGAIKLKKQTRLISNEYEVLENGAKEKLPFSIINTNLLCLYFQEPKDLKSVYCDIQQCFVNVIKTADGGYKVKFPNGNVNCYYYKEGVCTKIKIMHSFYSAEIILSPQNNSYANSK